MSKRKTEKMDIKESFKTIEKDKLTFRKNNTKEITNVNNYQHFLTIPSTNCSSILWALNLRTNFKVKNISSNTEPPQTYFKTIQSRKVKHTSADIDENVNISQFEHLVLHRVRPTVTYNQLRFETTLRTEKKQNSLVERQKKWCPTPKTERHEQPKFIKSCSLKKKLIQPQQMDSALDGMQNYPKFTQKIVKTKNCNQFRHMIKGQINLPTISWQVNLRQY